MLFLDANIFLDFYRFGGDDIQEMGKLVSLIRDKEIEVLKNNYLSDEVARMREATLANSFAELKSTKYNVKAPNYCERMSEYSELKTLLKEINKVHAKLLSETESKIAKKALPADKLIHEIMEKATEIQITDEVLAKARGRRDLNNPPGKKGEIGDAVHWEALLSDKRVKRLDIVSNDGDFESELEPGKIKAFLEDEWKKRKPGAVARVELFKSLTDYFKTRYPQIKLTDEVEKRNLVQRLMASPNFATTHSVISELSRYSYFTQGQVAQMFEALIENNQVAWIAEDEDVRGFYLGLRDFAWYVPDEFHERAAELLGVDASDFFLPF